MAKKKMDREELMEFKNGKYMGGPAEERAEKKKPKKKAKRYADGGMVEFGPDPGGNTGVVPQDMMYARGSRPQRRPLERPGMKDAFDGSMARRAGRDSESVYGPNMFRNRPGDVRPPGRPMGPRPMRSDDEGMLPPHAGGMPIPGGGMGRPGGLGDMIPAGRNPNKGYERPGMKGPMSPDKGFERPGMKGPAQMYRKGGVVKSCKMRGGGLARKGVGMALAKGGLVKGAGCVSHGVKKAKTY